MDTNKLNEEVIEILKRKILWMEKENLRTKKLNEKEIVKQIKKMIEEDVNAI